MMKSLILVESPTKAKTLFRFLKGTYQIEASMGHIRDLPKADLGIDIEDNFSPKYVIPTDKRKTVESLKHMVKDFDRIILATDPDREGEAIAYHLAYILKSEANKNAKFERIVFHEITPSAIEEALQNPHDIDYHLVNAQTARRVLDRIVGYKLSPLLWEKIKRNLSGGRVQSVALRLIVEREREIEKFTPDIYFKISAFLSKEKKAPVEFELSNINGEDIEISTKLALYDGDYRFTKTTLDQPKTIEILKNLPGLSYTVESVSKKETRRSPFPPFITSTLQQDASRRLRFSGRKTMMLAQKLYEEGYITYHRTDSFNLSNQFVTQARSYIEKRFGRKYVSDRRRVFKTKSKTAQEAHEAIRPTSFSSKTNEVSRSFGRDHGNLYDLIFRRALATQMAEAVFESTKILVKTTGAADSYLFEKNGSTLLFDGFLKLTGTADSEELLPEFKQREMLSYASAKSIESKTIPPPRYTEAGLIGALEKNGIGRPSTYAPIISTIEARFYAAREEGRFVPTAIGIVVNDFLVKNFATIDDIPFTAVMEDKLDAIAIGKSDWVPMIRDFYTPFEQSLKLAEKEEKITIEDEKTGQQCPECKQGDIVIKTGRFGKFYACSRFPDCKYKKTYREETDKICPKDGGIVIIKRTRRGRKFFGCSNYPKCTFAAWNLKDIDKIK